MTIRTTEDRCEASGADLVWEIMYKYNNAESSTAYGERRLAMSVPLTAKIWFHKINCQRECDRINRKRKQSNSCPNPIANI